MESWGMLSSILVRAPLTWKVGEDCKDGRLGSSEGKRLTKVTQLVEDKARPPVRVPQEESDILRERGSCVMWGQKRIQIPWWGDGQALACALLPSLAPS